jgi:hypothetical protein
MKRGATRFDHGWIVDPHHGLDKPRQGIGISFQSPAKRGELNRLNL